MRNLRKSHPKVTRNQPIVIAVWRGYINCVGFIHGLSLILALALFTTDAWADRAAAAIYPEIAVPARVIGAEHQATLKDATSRHSGLQIILAARLNAERNAVLDSSTGIVPLQVGFDRPIPALKNTATLTNPIPWHATVDGGWLGALTITSPGALAMRLGLLVEQLPDAAEMRFFAPNNTASAVILVRGELINYLIKLNVQSGISDIQQTQLYWSPVVEGEAIAVEIYLPPPHLTNAVSISIPRISHFYRAATDPNKDIGASYGCEVDVMCDSVEWQNQGKAVAKMIFHAGSGSYKCSGTLLNDQDPASYIPYFLSANHCISNQIVASTLETYWFYHASLCNSGELSSESQHLTGGAQLLYHTEDTDTSFMRLNTAPPAGVVFSGWDSATFKTGTSIAGLHHPAGDLQKISVGTVTGYTTCFNTSGGQFNCPYSNKDTDNHLIVSWNKGVTEGGSSGSGLFSSSSFELIGGQLHGGSSECYNYNESDYYGRFDIAYQNALYQWLRGVVATYTLFVSQPVGGSVSSQPVGINCGVDCTENYSDGSVVQLNAWPNAGYVFSGWGGDCTGNHSCQLTMRTDKHISAVFTALPVIYTLFVSATNHGTVTSNIPGINCGTDCKKSYAAGTSVTLTATPNAGYSFNSWGGSCTGSASCQLKMDSNKQVLAQFNALPTNTDFVVTGITLNPTMPTANSNFTAKVTVKNQGTVSGDGGSLLVWPNQNVAQSCGVIADKTLAVSALAAGESKTLTVALSAGVAGNKTLRAFVDGNCNILESDESNNQLTKPYTVSAGVPDFAIISIALNPSEPAINSFFTTKVTIKNNGTAAADAGYLDVWSDQANIVFCGASGDKWKDLGNLAAGEMKTVEIPFHAVTVGKKTLRAFIDSWCETSEALETNNQLTKTYTVQ